VEIGPVFSKEMSSSWITCLLVLSLLKTKKHLTEYFKVSKKTSGFFIYFGSYLLAAVRKYFAIANGLCGSERMTYFQEMKTVKDI